MKQVVSFLVVLLLLFVATIISNGSDAASKKTQKTIASAEASTISSMQSSETKAVKEDAKDYPEATETAVIEKLGAICSSDDCPQSNSYSDYDLDLLARVIYAEAGCYWIPDWVQLYVGSVVLNRVDSDIYPNTIEEVLYDPGQYVPVSFENATPDERTISNARQLLENGSILPPDVLGQNGFAAGDGIYAQYYDVYLDTVIYFTYVH